jgi:hypothetical protein
LAQAWGVVWVAGGVFSVVLGLGALTLALAWASDGTLGTFLRSRPVSIAIVLAVLGSMCVTLYYGALNYFR